MTVSIKLGSIDEKVAVNIEGLGTIYVKKESSNQGLKTSENMRDVFKLQDESKNIQKQVKKLLEEGKNEESPEIKKLEVKSLEKLDKITEIRKIEHEMKKSRLSDDENGKLVEFLFNNASDEDIARVFAIGDGRIEENEDGSEENS